MSWDNDDTDIFTDITFIGSPDGGEGPGYVIVFIIIMIIVGLILYFN